MRRVGGTGDTTKSAAFVLCCLKVQFITTTGFKIAVQVLPGCATVRTTRRKALCYQHGRSRLEHRRQGQSACGKCTFDMHFYACRIVDD